MKDFLQNIGTYITAEYIALLSVIITVLIFVISRQSELKYKKHDDRKIQYIKLIELMNEFLMGSKKDKKAQTQITDELKKKFFDVGSSLLLYGSKKLYKQYIFFREFSSNLLVPKCKYYKDNLIIYIMARILTTMRREVGLSNFNTIQSHEALGFFVNDMSNNPIAKANAYEAKFRIKMIRLELFLVDRTQFVFIKKIYYALIKPIIGFIALFWKYLVSIPFGKLLMWLFPKFMERIGRSNQNK